jgi:hypothetical protein
MSMLSLLLVVFLVLVLFGNPHLGGHIFSGYNYGYWPSGIGLILFIVVLVILLRGGL